VCWTASNALPLDSCRRQADHAASSVLVGAAAVTDVASTVALPEAGEPVEAAVEIEGGDPVRCGACSADQSAKPPATATTTISTAAMGRTGRYRPDEE
jgi:hypothetical protein